MALTSGGGGDDRLQVGMAVFAIVISLLTTLMVPMMVDESSTGYSADEIAEGRLELEAFTGESMINNSPWQLTAVYTPYIPGLNEPKVFDRAGWVYGSKLDSYTLDGKSYLKTTTDIKLDPDQKSLSALDVSEQTVRHITHHEAYVDANGNVESNTVAKVQYQLVKFWTKLTGGDTSSIGVTYENAPAYNFTGYLYSFQPMLRIATHTESGGTTTEKEGADDATLSLVWYSYGGQEGLSSGLVLYSQRDRAVIKTLSAGDIVSNYSSGSAYASNYPISFDGTTVTLSIKFDSSVVSSGKNLYSAFVDGDWSMALYAASASDFLDISNSTSFTTSVGNLLQTYIQIFTFSLPSVDIWWATILWIICIMPVDLTVLMFLSRFGVAGIGAGILGNVLAFLGLS